MNIPLIIYTQKHIGELLQTRVHETRLGEKIRLCSSGNLEESLRSSPAKYVLIGLPEDIGVRANQGREGAAGAWEHALKALLNIQSNSFLSGEEILLLGHLDFSEAEEKATGGNLETLRELCSTIDDEVADLIRKICSAGKEAIVIGGGHNNSYGCIKGVSQTLGEAINCINADPHSDYRVQEGRHSGNGFRYAKTEGYLNKYSIFGLQENYSPGNITNDLNVSPGISYTSFESMIVRNDTSFEEALKKETDFVWGTAAGIEIDLDGIEGMPSSAVTPSGFSASQARRFVHYSAFKLDAKYLHIAEGAPSLGTHPLVGKMIAFLVTDYIKARELKPKAKLVLTD